MNSNLTYDYVSDGLGHILIQDISADTGAKTVTNAAEEVVRRIHSYGGLAGRRLFYRDTEGAIDELLHDGKGEFMGFKAGHEGVDL